MWGEGWGEREREREGVHRTEGNHEQPGFGVGWDGARACRGSVCTPSSGHCPTGSASSTFSPCGFSQEPSSQGKALTGLTWASAQLWDQIL